MLDWADSALVPIELLAVTMNVYDAPGVSPVIFAEVAELGTAVWPRKLPER